VVLDGVSLGRNRQGSFYLSEQSIERSTRLMVDELNRSIGRDTLTIAVAGIKQKWQMKRNEITPFHDVLERLAACALQVTSTTLDTAWSRMPADV
jgi:hypothetical protein